MKIVFFGTPQFAVPSLERLAHHSAFEVMAVVTQPDKRRGRGNDLMPSPVKALATTLNVPVWQPRSVKKDSETLHLLQASTADVFVVVAYGQILSQAILDMPRLGCVNAHGSLLPQYRGAAPIQWSLHDGNAETGITTMLMDAGMDTGAMLLKRPLPIGLLDTADDVAIALSQLAADLLVETLLGLDQGTVSPIPQNDAEATYARLIKKEDYILDWSQGAIALHHKIRGFYPNCVATLGNAPLKVLATLPSGIAPDQIPQELHPVMDELNGLPQNESPIGTVVSLLKNHGAVIQTGDGLLLMRQVQPAGKRSQSGWDFVNGNRLQIGEQLG
jgi:methionyl-tRNA formyltransferase